MEENSEVLLKYQKLALEYSKLKAQVGVLKSAVSEEQSNVIELQETLKKKDQLVRKLEQEVECLNFRNIQLAKRVSVLQTDLESIDLNAKHSKSKHSTSVSPTPETYSVLNIELQSRIDENEKLHKQIYALDLEHQKKMADLLSTIENLELKVAHTEKQFGEKLSEQEMMVNALQKEKIKMQVSIKNHEQEIKKHQNSVETKAQDDTSVKEELTLQLADAKKTIAEKVLFNDRYVDSWNALNVPIIQRGKHEHLSTLMQKMQGFISDFCRQMSDLHTFMIQRLCTAQLEPSVKFASNKLEEYLKESIQSLKAIPKCFESIIDALKTESLTWDKSSVSNFSNIFGKYEMSLHKLLPYLILRIENKNSWTASAKLVDIITKLVLLSKKLIACFKTLQRYISLLAVVGSSDETQYCVSQATIVGKVLSNIEVLQQYFDNARKLFGSKITLDHQLPMISQSEKSTDECILAALVSLSRTSKKVKDLIEKELDVFSCNVWYQPRSVQGFRNGTLNSYVWQYKDRGSKYMEHISEYEEPSIPYEISLENSRMLHEQADSQENLRQQLEQYQNKLMQLELDKENWMLECQLMKAKEAKVDPDSPAENLENRCQDYDEIHRYVKNTVNQLIKQIQFADSKTISFKNECEMLHQRLKLSLEKKEASETEMLNLQRIIENMKDEQKTLVQSYDEQLNTMSEHLANLNETLTAQKDEIDVLRQSGNKASKKGRLK